MKKRTLAIVLTVLAVLAGLWLLRGQTAEEHISQEPQVTSSLVALDDDVQEAAENASTPTDDAAGAEIHDIPMTRERILQSLRDKEAARRELSRAAMKEVKT